MVKQKKQNDKYVVGRTLSTYSGKSKTIPTKAKSQAKNVPTIDEPNALSKKKLLLITLILVLITILIICIWDLYNYSKASKKVFGTGNLIAALIPAKLDGSDRQRINVMIVGYSNDDPGHAGANLTDSIMIISMSTEGKSSYLLNIPRDLYIKIPDFGAAKINEAYQRGETAGFAEAGYPNGGVGLLEKTITESIGIPIDYYAIVNYSAVRDTTNALGGITVNIQSSDPRGLYDPNFQPHEGGPLQISNGNHKIDGQTALKLTRARGAAGGYGFNLSDFDRTKNQQQVFIAIKDAISWQVLLNPTKNHQFLNGIANNTLTDVEINEALPLYRLFKQIPNDQLNQISLKELNGSNLLRSYSTPTGQSALVPAAGIYNYSQIQSAISELNE